MKKLLILSLFALLSFSHAVLAKTIKTTFFEVDLPKDWVQVKDVTEEDNSLFATFSNKQNGTAVIIVIKPNKNYSLKETVDKTTKQLFSEFKVNIDSVQEVDGIYVIDYTFKNAKGRYFMSMNDKSTCSILVTASNANYGNELIKAISPTKNNETLFPSL